MSKIVQTQISKATGRRSIFRISESSGNSPDSKPRSGETSRNTDLAPQSNDSPASKAVNPRVTNFLVKSDLPLVWKNSIVNAFKTSFNRDFSSISDVEPPKDGNDRGPRSISDKRGLPESLADIKPPEELMESFKKRQREMLTPISTQLGLKYNELCEQLTQLFSEDLPPKIVCRRFEAHEMLRALELNSFESTHQKQSSVGKEYGPEKLQQIANLHWALCGYPQDTPSEMRPLHAIATDDPYGELGNPALKQFGSIVYVFEDSIKDFSTVLGGDSIRLVNQEDNGKPDSMQIYAIPAPLKQPTYDIFPVEKCPQFDPRRTPGIDYWEVGIHRALRKGNPLGPRSGGRMVIGNPEELGKEMKLKSKCDEGGIQCDVGRNKRDSERLREKVEWIRDAFPPMEGLNMDWVVDGKLAVGGSFQEGDVNKLRCLGIKHVIDTRAEKMDNAVVLEGKGIGFSYLPAKDRDALSLKQLKDGTDQVIGCLEKGEPVLIHCEEGIGRSGMLACAVLMRMRKIGANAALQELERKRSGFNPTQAQKNQLFEFEKQLRLSGDL